MAGTMTTRRSAGKRHVGRALWYVRPGVAELRSEPLDVPAPGQARVRMLFSGISRGTERLVFTGGVSASEWRRMRAPLQTGDFPFPVKYGYCATGVVEDGPDALVGRTVFALHPHQDMFLAPADMLTEVPDGVPAKRATLAANMETALNAHWDAGTGPGDRIVVIGAGIVGLMVAHLAARLPGAHVTVVDPNAAREPLVRSFGAEFRTDARALSGSADVAFHTSVTAGGLNDAIASAGQEATIVELSWYGDREVAVRLGDAFHSQRLKLVSSQVGQVAPTRRPRWPYKRRLETALALLADERLDALVSDEIAFGDAPARLPGIFAADYRGLSPVIRY